MPTPEVFAEAVEFTLENPTTCMTWSRDVPDEIRSLCGMEGADYGDAFGGPLPPGRDRSAEEWAHLALDVRPGPLRAPVVAIQRYLLGFRLQPKGQDRFLGWKVAAKDKDWIRLQATSSYLSAEMVFKVDEEALRVGCFVRYDRRLGAVVWPPLSRIHRRAGLLMMRRVFRQS
jgi:hypothetical protein